MSCLASIWPLYDRDANVLASLSFVSFHGLLSPSRRTWKLCKDLSCVLLKLTLQWFFLLQENSLKIHYVVDQAHIIKIFCILSIILKILFVIIYHYQRYSNSICLNNCTFDFYKTLPIFQLFLKVYSFVPCYLHFILLPCPRQKIKKLFLTFSFLFFSKYFLPILFLNFFSGFARTWLSSLLHIWRPDPVTNFLNFRFLFLFSVSILSLSSFVYPSSLIYIRRQQFSGARQPSYHLVEKRTS